MSSSRRIRRNAARNRRVVVIARDERVELSHGTREVVATTVAAHDDPSVSLHDMVAVMANFAAHVERLPERERQQAAFLVSAHARLALTGRHLKAIVFVDDGDAV